MKKLFTFSMLTVFTFSFGQKLFIVKSDEKFGIINESGVEVIPPKYTSIDDFDKMQPNWAKVELENLYGFVDKTIFTVFYDHCPAFVVFVVIFNRLVFWFYHNLTAFVNKAV